MLSFLLGIGLALASASSYSVGVILQSLEARRVPATESLRLSLLKQLMTRRRWVIGTLCVLLGWALQAAALALAPLTVVQPALAVGLFVLLIAGARLSQECIGRREIIAVTAISVGVAGLGFASPKGEDGGHAAPLVLVPALAGFVAAALCPYLLRGDLRARTLPVLVVISAALAYAASGFMTKFVADAFSRTEFLAAAAWLAGTICAAGLGLVSEMTALQKRSAIRVFPGVLVIQIVLAVLLAPLLAGEAWSADPLLLLVLGASLVVLAAGTAVLASAGAIAAAVDSKVASKAPAEASHASARGGPMTTTTPAEGPRGSNAWWRETLAPYARPRPGRSLLDIATSVVPYAVLFVAMYLALDVSYWLALAIAVPASGFLLRTYILFHDCTHGSLFASRRANIWLGTGLGLVVYSNFLAWRHSHAVHHATAGDLDRRGTGDIPTYTVAEYQAMSRPKRIAYWLFRHPLVMFTVGPVYALVVQPRLVSRDARRRIKRSVHATNLALVVLVGLLCWAIGWREFLLVQAPMVFLAGTAGVWLFYVQHQFEDVYWEPSEQWSYADAALRGSSHLELGPVLRFFTGSIGLHHVHHLNARVPNYCLQRAHDENPVFHSVPTLSFLDGIKAVRLKLVDEQSGRLVTFAEARRTAAEPATSASDRSSRRPWPTNASRP